MEILEFLPCLALILFASFPGNCQSAIFDASQCGKSNPTGVQKRVVYGRTAQPGAWPWQALILYGYGKTFLCSGALIHPSWILTAAHCIRNRNPELYKVRLGEFDRMRKEGREQTLNVAEIIAHPLHDSPVDRNNDLALVKLKTPAKMTDWVGTVCLPTAADYLHKDLNCYATGWGLTGRGNGYSRKLQQAHVPLVTKKKCRARANSWRRGAYRWHLPQQITHQMLCGGNDETGASTCMGDSGGPYVCRNPKGRWVLQGITSWGSRNCKITERYSVFSKVGVFTSWIETVINSTKTESKGTTYPKVKTTHSENNKTTEKGKGRLVVPSFLRWLLKQLLKDAAWD